MTTATDAPAPSEPEHRSTDRDQEPTIGRYVRWIVAACAVTAAAIHFGFAPTHLSEDWAHGWFFLLTGWLGVVFAVLVVVRPRRWVWAGGLLLNAGIMGTWAVSRTAGLPFGPAALRKESVTAPDVLSTVLEGVVVLGALVALLAPKLMERPVHGRRLAPTFTALTALAVFALGSVSMTPAYAGTHTGAAAHSHAGEAPVGAVSGWAVGTTPCEKSGPPASPGQAAKDAEGHSHRGPALQEPIDQATQIKLQAQQAEARTVAVRYPTVADAEAAGYHMSVTFVPCIGAHYTNIAKVAKFDPAEPSELLYDGTKPDSKIIGLSYLVWNPGGAPEGFAGPNDRWHQHNVNGGLCFSKNGTVIGGEEQTTEQCVADGGAKRELTDIWMVHDWIVPGWECTWGAFAGECPELGGRTGGTAWDAPDPAVTGQAQSN
jgi:hypothetical protein